MSTTQKLYSLNRGGSTNRVSFRTAYAARLMPLVLLLTLPAGVPAQYYYKTNNGTIALVGYTGTNSVVSIPSSITGLPVTSIGDYTFQFNSNLTSIIIPNSLTSIGSYAFSSCSSLTNLTMPNSIISIGNDAFSACTNLTSITLPNGVTSVQDYTFHFCTGLTSVTLPNGLTSIGSSAFSYCSKLGGITLPSGVTNIGNRAFYACVSLTNITLPNSVTSLETYAFASCLSLTGVCCQGSAPSLGSDVFYDDTNTIVYYLPGITGWETMFGGCPTAPWGLPNPVILNQGPSFGVQTNRFGFIISWATNLSVVVEACTNLAHPIWSPVRTNTLTSGSSYFSDPQWTNSPARFYRLRSP